MPAWTDNIPETQDAARVLPRSAAFPVHVHVAPPWCERRAGGTLTLAGVLVQGYGVTLGTINFLGVLAALFQAMPSLSFQARAARAGAATQRV